MTDLVNYREKVNRINITRKLSTMQSKLNEIYEKEGLTDEVLEMQLEINKIRHEENIPDIDETIWKNYVQ